MSSFGEEFKRERELREISLRDVAGATKINLRFLEALECNEFEHLPGGLFNRGFVRSYAEFIGVDPEAMVNAYLLEEQSQSAHGKVAERHLLRRSRNRDRPPHEGEAAHSSRSWLLWVIALVVVGGGIALTVWLTKYGPLRDDPTVEHPPARSARPVPGEIG